MQQYQRYQLRRTEGAVRVILRNIGPSATNLAAISADQLALLPVRKQPLQRAASCLRATYECGSGNEGLLHLFQADEQRLGNRIRFRRSSGTKSQRHAGSV